MNSIFVKNKENKIYNLSVKTYPHGPLATTAETVIANVI